MNDYVIKNNTAKRFEIHSNGFTAFEDFEYLITPQGSKYF